MMKKNIQYLISTILLLLFLCSPAAAAAYYIGIHGGMGFLPEAQGSDSEGRANFTYDADFDGSVTLGYDLESGHQEMGHGRVELEFNRAANDIDEAEFIEGNVPVVGSVERTSIMFNTIGEYTTRSGVIIYALLGLGWADISLDNISVLGEPFVDDSNSQLAYQAGLGAGWKLSNHLIFELGYRYYGTLDPEFTKKDGTNLDYEYVSHRFLAGLRLHF